MHRLFRRPRELALSFGLLAILFAAFAHTGGSPAAAQGNLPQNWIKGIVMIGYAADPYAERNVPASLAELAKTGANQVSLAPRWFTPDLNSTVIAPNAD